MFHVKDQVVVKERTARSGPVTREIKVGSVMAVSDDGKTMTVSLPQPGGMTVRKVVETKNCEPVTDVFRRNSVQVNPAFRQLYKGPV